MTMSIQPPHRIGSGDDITTMSTNTMTVIETKKRANKTKDCGDTNTSSLMKKRKDCGDTNTSTVMETEKRKDYGDTNTSTVMETKKRKDSGGDTTNTTTVMEKKKRAYRRKDCIIGGTNTPTVMEKKKRPYRRKKSLPHDLIVEEILTKLPVPTLLKSVLVSKLWYNSIHNDRKHLTYSHFLQSQKQPDIIFSLLNVRNEVVKKNGQPEYGSHFFRFNTRIYGSENVLKFDKFRGHVVAHGISEMVGYCHGLPCVAASGKYSTAYMVLDPNSKDFLCIFHPAKVGKLISESRIICHGFGFDPSANEYKLVSVFRTPQKELNFVVFTLGTKSWRNVTATSMPILGHQGRLVLKIRAPTDSDKSAIFCTTSSSSSSGCLVWKIITTFGGAGSNIIQHDNSGDVSNEMEMLLSFSLHDEKFQFIQLPAKSTTDEQQKHLLVDYDHLLEFKGSPCIAHIEKASGNGSDYSHRCRDDHQESSSCCCCCIVHLYVLKDKVKQVWVKEESFDVRINSTLKWYGNVGNLARDPCCFCFGSTTRIFGFSDQMLLYWFSGEDLQVYNLRSEKLQLVMPILPREDDVFQAKMIEPRHIFNYCDDADILLFSDDDIYRSTMDYQLHCHEENFLSLETFIPEGVKGVDADDFRKSDLKRCSVYMFIYRGSKVYYPFN